MELIKQIKDAEKQAKDIVEKARQDAAVLVEDTKKQHSDLQKRAQQRRVRTIDEAVKQAGQAGASQADEITQAGSKEIEALKASSSAKIQSCVDKVLSCLQQTS